MLDAAISPKGIGKKMEEKELLLKIDELRFYVKTIGDINMLQSEFERGWDYGYRRGLKQALEILEGTITIL